MNAMSLLLLLSAMMLLSKARKMNTVEYAHIISCVKHILYRDFKDIHPVVVSLPEICRDSAPRRLDISNLPEQDHQHLSDELLKIVSNFTVIQMTNPSMASGMEYTGNDDQTRHRGYIIFLFSCNPVDDEDSEKDDEQLEYILDDQLTVLMEKFTFNAYAKFIVIVPEMYGDNTESFVFALIKGWWKLAKMVKFVIILPHSSIRFEKKNVQVQNPVTDVVLDLFSWSPYVGDNCDGVDKVILLDQWMSNNGGQFLRNKSLYNFILPTTFHGCPFNVGSFGPEPYVIADANYTVDNGVELKDVTGLTIDIFYTFTKKYNFTMNFIVHKKELSGKGSTSKMFLRFLADEIHLLGGTLLPMVTNLMFGEMSHPIIYDAAKYIVPCPVPIGKMWRILNTFTVSTWVALIVVLFLSSFLTQLNTKSNKKEYKMFSKFLYCVFSNWAVLLGISTPQIPLSSRIRHLFIIYVWFCFAISQVFQAYFVTYLVEPGYGKKLETLEDLRLSKITYAWFHMTETITVLLGVVDFKEIAYATTQCFDVYPCTERVILYQNMSALTSPFLAWYIARKKGFQRLNKVVCFLEESLFTFFFPVLVRKGCPILPLINRHIITFTEAGLQERYRSQLIHEILLRADETRDEVLMYSVFTMAYLGPVFSLFLFGCMVSAFVFICEIVLNFCRKKLAQMFLSKYQHSSGIVEIN